MFAFLFFILSVGLGYLFAKSSPEEVKKILEQLRIVLEPLQQMTRLQQVFFIFLNNSLTGFLAILLGVIIGLFPLLTLFANGEMLGVLIFFSKENLPLSEFFTGIFPHGIIEIPVLLLCGAMGLKIGAKVLKKIFKKKENIQEEIKLALSFFFKFLIPLLFVAAIIEVFVTRELLIR